MGRVVTEMFGTIASMLSRPLPLSKGWIICVWGETNSRSKPGDPRDALLVLLGMPLVSSAMMILLLGSR